MTLIELLLALAGTAMVGVAIATMLVAVAYGTQSDKDLRTLVVKYKTVDGRVSASLRGSHMVLAQGSDYLVLWMFDTDGSAAPNLSEIRRIECANGVLTSYKAPDNLDPLYDVAYALADDFDAITAAIKGDATFPGEIWATDVTDWTIALNENDPQAATLVSYRLTFQAGILSDIAINAVALRN